MTNQNIVLPAIALRGLSLIHIWAPDMAENLYKYIIARCKEHIDIVEQGEFGADMKVELVNDGPFTVILDSNEL